MFSFFRKFISRGGVRVRIAPSPTGYLHIGTARTALFNYLFAKKNNGEFILRIEDTDLERSDEKYEKDIIEGLRWLGLKWDGKITRQSERIGVYEKYITKLLNEKKAYYCACSKEDLEKERQTQLDRGESPRYSGKCRGKNISEKGAELIRFEISDETVKFNDLIRGEISFDASLVGDMAIAKNKKTPLYNFAVVVDDYEMKITHVIRGEDHIANTPKQILLQKALGFSHPKYAHLPLILNSDRSKMSKRFAAVSVKNYREEGYLAEAMVNFMALLGWHPEDDREKMPLKEIIGKFDLDRMQKGGAIFDVKKLNWLNSQYIKERGAEELFGFINALYPKLVGDKETALKILKAGKTRLEKLSGFRELKASFGLAGDYDANLLIWKNTSQEIILENLRKTKEIIRTENKIMPFANESGRGEVLWPLRVALSGKDKSPGPFEILDVIGKEEALKRIDAAIEKLS